MADPVLAPVQLRPGRLRADIAIVPLVLEILGFDPHYAVRTAGAVLARVGCRGFTMDEVACELGISKATLYSHFASRGDLIRRALSEPHEAAVAEIGRRIEDARGEGLRGAADDLVRGCLGLGEARDEPTLLCCLAEIECPYADWDELDRLFDRLSADGRRSG